VLEHLLCGSTLVVVPSKHGKEEIVEGLGFFFLDEVLLSQDLLQGPVIQTADSAEVTTAVEEFARMFPRNSEVGRHLTEELHHLSEMVIVLVISFSFAGLEQEVTGAHLKDSASKTPNIGGSIILRANNYFRRTILTRLNLRSEVLVSPAAIAHVADLNLYVFS